MNYNGGDLSTRVAVLQNQAVVYATKDELLPKTTD